MTFLLVLLPIVAGIAVSVQAAVNGRLGSEVGTIESTYISFLTGSIFLTFVVVFFGKGNLLLLKDVPAWQLLCAFFGIIFVLLMVFSVPKIGVTTTTVLVVIGQLSAGMAIDHYGLFLQEVNVFNWKRFFGFLLLLGALYFIYREKSLAQKS